MRSLALVGFEDFIASCGGNAVEVLSSVGLDEGLLHTPDRVYPYQAHLDLWENAAEMLGEPNLGLKYAQYMDPNFVSFGTMLVLARFERDIRGWLMSSQRYLRYHTSGAVFSIREIPGTQDLALRMTLDPLIQKRRQVAEGDAALVMLLARRKIATNLQEPKLLRFPHARPEDTSLHEEIFRCPLEFNSPFMETVVDRAFLDHKLHSPFRFAKPMVHWFANRIANRSPTAKTSMAHQVRMTMSLHLGTNRLNIESLSETLGLHPKALQRQLAEEGETFSALLELVRKEVAVAMLTTSNASIAEIAGYLNYSSASSFVLAFKRWKGEPPLRYRRNQN